MCLFIFISPCNYSSIYHTQVSSASFMSGATVATVPTSAAGARADDTEGADASDEFSGPRMPEGDEEDEAGLRAAEDGI